VLEVTRSLHEIRLGLFATEEQVERLQEAVVRLLCPEPGHAGPCAVPWTISRSPAAGTEYPELVEQERTEGQ
jgi:hypothetical protein